MGLNLEKWIPSSTLNIKTRMRGSESDISSVIFWYLAYRQVPKLSTLNVKTRFASLTY